MHTFPLFSPFETTDLSQFCLQEILHKNGQKTGKLRMQELWTNTPLWSRLHFFQNSVFK